ncbi:MAG TPA: gluconate 2-dehydrogenase subunit 3 family protein [Acidobacteriaceae bacterium]
MNAHQNETVITISELIIPQTDTPGAKGAKVNEFIDLLLTEWFDAPEKARFLEGLASLDAASRKRFGSDFISTTAAQQQELMKQFDDEAMGFVRRQNEKPVVRTTSARTQKARKTPAIDREPLHPGEFFYTLKKFTIFGYYTSEIGFSQELGDSIIPPGHDGCAPLKETAR